MTESHAGAEDLFLFSEGLLDDGPHRLVAAHLSTCAICAERYRREAELTVSLKSLPAPTSAPGLVADVTRAIRRQGALRASPWWWLVGACLLVLSGAQWLVASDLTVAGAGAAFVHAGRDLTVTALSVVQALADPQTWLHVAEAAAVALDTTSTSTLLLMGWFFAAALVAVAANALLWSMARRVLAIR
ncbi:MAG: hypothetical protein KKA32_13920 [Actinobacteria bacterium]|nr:hypothetical protein [Actinomycetota bacterium]